jgi:succinyl-diaminopimelate desuccinylase
MELTLALAKKLISCPSITPNDANCQKIIKDFFADTDCKIVNIDSNTVTNLWITHGSQAPIFAFAGHTDVVDPGDLTSWQTDPFTPTIIDGYLYGRGAQDMKGSLAAMCVAFKQYIIRHPQHRGTIGLLITSGEEGDQYAHGTPVVLNYLAANHQKIDWCIVGEPSSQKKLGDTLRNGRRGSLTGHLQIKGVQGHVAYAHLAKNPIHVALPVLTKLSTHQWDNGNDYFPATSFQITNIHAGCGANNIIPETIDIHFNLRYSSELTYKKIDNHVRSLLESSHLDNAGFTYILEWELSGEPFLTKPGVLLSAVSAVIERKLGYAPTFSTGGGTSDARFIAKTGAEVIELGPCNDRIHKVNERVLVTELEQLTAIYLDCVENLI